MSAAKKPGLVQFSTRPSRSAKKLDLSNFPVRDIRVAFQNAQLYDDFAVGNGDDWALVESVRETGIQEPLVLSADLGSAVRASAVGCR